MGGATRETVYRAIDTELDYVDRMADKAHGDPSNDKRKSLEDFAIYIDDYVRELKTQLARTWGPDAYEQPLHTLRKIAGLAVRAMEVRGVRERTTPTKHAAGTDLT